MKNESRYVYEVVDQTDEEYYYPLGIFLTLKEAKDAIYKAALLQTKPISEYVTDVLEIINIKKRKLGWGGYGDTVYTLQREPRYDEKRDDYFWEIIDVQIIEE